MAGYSAPGVYRKEIDLSEILRSTGISNGGIVIRSRKGPVARPVLVQNDKEFIETFGEPYFVSGTSNEPEVPELGYGSYGALEFLVESENLYVVRAYDDDVTTSKDNYGYVEINTSGTAEVATSGLVPTKVSDLDTFDKFDYISTYENHTFSNPLLIGALGPGFENNDIAVTVETLNPYSDWLYRYDEYPSDTSATSAAIPTKDKVYNKDYTLEPAGLYVPKIWVTSASGSETVVKNYFPIASDVIKINVYVKPNDKEWDDLYSNEKDKTHDILRIDPVEVFYGSQTEKLDSDGNDIYIERVINGNSKYIYVKSNDTSVGLDACWDFSGVSATTPTWYDYNGNVYVKKSVGDVNGQFAQLSGGSFAVKSGLDSGDADFWSFFTNREEVPVNILINTSYDDVHKLESAKVCAKRRDCIVSSPVGDHKQTTPISIINKEKYGYPDPSFVALYSGYSLVYDKYNDRRVYIPNSIYGASLMARVDRIAEPWYAPAGQNRGTLSVINENKVFSRDQIGVLYDRNINSVKYIQGSGFVMFGQKTAQLKASALDRINVRRTLIYIEVNIENFLNSFVFENNTHQTRLRVFSIIDNFLAGIKAADGLYDYNVVCDESNNPPSVIDQNQLNVDIYVQPTKTIEFIQFTTVITRTGVNFSDYQLKYV